MTAVIRVAEERRKASAITTKHRFGIQEEGDTLSDYYGVSGIPHVVVLDKEGKVRMIRVGSGKQNAEDIDHLLAELLK
jgi:hypothetical protein